MTNTEAITKLTNIAHDDHYSWHPSILTAFNMAVDALKGTGGDCISREGLKENLLSEDYETHDYCFPCKEIMKRIEEQPSAQPEQSESEDITFWKKRAREYEEMVLKLTDEMARGIKIDSVLITEEGIVFKKEQPEQRWIPCGKCIHADGKHRWCKILDRTINEDYFCYWAEPFREEGETEC